MSISNKLMVAMISLTSLVLIATLSLARWSFEQGFSDFLQGLEEQRLNRMAQDIVEYYTQNEFSLEGIQFGNVNAFIDSSRRAGARGPSQGPGRRPPPHLRPKQTLHADRINNQPPPFPKQRNAPPTRLIDSKGNVLLSDTINEEYFEQAIKVALPIVFEGQEIAQLESYNLKPLQSQLASEFAKQQTIASVIIGCLSLILASLLAFLIGRKIISPLKVISSSVSELTKGNYELALKTEGKDELAKLMKDIEFLANTLSKAKTQKSRWFADISHELRTPLTILLGEIEAMQLGIRSLDKQQLGSLEHEVKLINRLVDDLYQLSLSDLGALKYEFSTVNLSLLIKSVAENFAVACNEKSIDMQFHIEPNIYINADAQRINQLVINLINNSLKYTDDGGLIRIGLASKHNTYVLAVDDSYPSVPEEDCMQLFETLYQRNESRTRANSGAGLGLSICKNIADSHQAIINAKPSDLGGLQINVAFPKR
ncbi:ATP-binding protein [Glaciecola sp. KUL10]|uniref:ATP-binding protein n=1 Tax=Glaciecola sp. (strain KUL10) TaxID=2161813 RepID=UPI000D785F6A|nr:ATP-binding protein [Glaciecola sp. KUL10]